MMVMILQGNPTCINYEKKNFYKAKFQVSQTFFFFIHATTKNCFVMQEIHWCLSLCVKNIIVYFNMPLTAGKPMHGDLNLMKYPNSTERIGRQSIEHVLPYCLHCTALCHDLILDSVIDFSIDGAHGWHVYMITRFALLILLPELGVEEL